jgi:ketosteroid isomerase-like protein
MVTTNDVLDHHIKCFGEGDLQGILSDYSSSAVLFTPEGPLSGVEAIRPFFQGMIREFAQPGTTFTMTLRSVVNEFAYVLWTAETADNVYEMATDTLVIRDGKIVAQSFAAKITPKGDR